MRSVRLIFAAAVVALAGCDQSPVAWNDPAAAVRTPAPTRLMLDSAGRAEFVAASSPVTALPSAPGLCAATVTTAQGAQHLFAVWWSVRPDSSAVLYSAASADSGKTWGIPAVVDTADISSRGCSRPPPSPTTVGDDLHVAYSMVASDGTGVFFAHFMGSMLHSPVAVIYGDRLVSTAIAADGERVAVAYENPNGKRQQVNVAYSPTQGHIFEWRSTATRDIDVATSPLIALRGNEIAVSWDAQKFAGGAASTVVRVGRIK